MTMSRVIRPYKRKKGSQKQKNNLSSFNIFTDDLVQHYFKPINSNPNIKKRNKSS